MKVVPLAADSLGARSMATLVQTADVTILLDPAVRLAPSRDGLPPHPAEEERQGDLWRRIREASRRADVLTVSHYHYDHHNPDAPSIYKGKVAFLKDGKFHINRSQRERASAFVKALKTYPKEIRVADGHVAEFGRTEIAFSPAVPHGYNDELGYVVMARISDGDSVFVHTGDVLGPPLKEQLGFLLDANPTLLYVDGPMTHLPENYPPEQTRKSLANLRRILEATDVRTVIVDHHLLRDADWQRHLEPLAAIAAEHDVRLTTAAAFAGQPVDPLESRRHALYGLSRPGPDSPSSAGGADRTRKD